MCSRIVENKDTIVQQIGNQIDLSQYDGFYALGTHSTHYIRFWGTKNVQSLSINQNGSANVGQRVGQFCANYNANKSNWLAGGSQQSFNQVSNVWYFGLLNIESSNGYVDNCLINNQGFFNQYEYLVFNNDLPNTAYNNSVLTYYFQGDFYSSPQIKIGNIQPNDSYYFELRLKDSVTGIVKGTSFVSLNMDPINIYNDGAIFIDDGFDVYVVNRLLKYSTQYQLEIESYYGDGGDNLFEDIDWFIFLPENAVVSGDYILSLGSGDFTNQDSTNLIIDNQNENNNNIIDFANDYSQVNGELDDFFSGDTSSIVSNLNFPNLDNNYFVVIYNVVSGISDTLRMSGDPYFDVSLHGETPKRIYASDFTTPSSVLKTFISMSLVFGTLYILYLQLSGFIMLLNTGHIKDALNQIDDISGNTLYKM